MRIIPALDGLRQEKFNLIYRPIWLVLKPARGDSQSTWSFWRNHRCLSNSIFPDYAALTPAFWTFAVIQPATNLTTNMVCNPPASMAECVNVNMRHNPV